ncbi:MAG: hypothetical protein ACSHX6_01200 [Akkermansiaceae bacterium]
MNTVRILICATFALLIAALVHSYSTKGNPNEKSISELKEELERVRLENSLKRERAAANPVAYGQYETPYSASTLPAPPNTTIPAPAPTPTQPAAFVNPLAPAVTAPSPSPSLTPPPATIAESTPSEEDIAKIEALEAENAKLKKQQSQQEAENNMLHEEAGAIQSELLAQKQPEEARAAEIAQALVMARVQIYDPESGIVVLDLERAQNLITGQILGIRRGEAGGIIGRVKLGNIESAQLGYADPIAESFFGGPVDVQVGDEIIVIP